MFYRVPTTGFGFCFDCGKPIFDYYFVSIRMNNMGLPQHQELKFHNMCFEASAGSEFLEPIRIYECKHKFVKSSNGSVICKKCNFTIFEFYNEMLKKTNGIFVLEDDKKT